MGKAFRLHRLHQVLPLADGDKPHRCLRALGGGGAVQNRLTDGCDERTLGAQLVKAPPLGAAGIGPQGLARPAVHPGVDVAQGGIGRAGALQGTGVDGGVAARRTQLAVEAQQMKPPVRRRGKARQRVVLPVGGGEGAAVHGAVELGQHHPLQLRLCKDIYVVRPAVDGVGRPGVKIVVVARGDKHRHGHFPQGRRQRPDGLRVHPAPVQQVAGEQNQVHPLLPGQPGQPGGNVPQLPPAQGALIRRKAGEGGVQVKIGGVEHFHRCPS